MASLDPASQVASVLALGLCLITACTTHPPPGPPDAAAPSSYAFTAPAAPSATPSATRPSSADAGTPTDAGALTDAASGLDAATTARSDGGTDDPDCRIVRRTTRLTRRGPAVLAFLA